MIRFANVLSPTLHDHRAMQFIPVPVRFLTRRKNSWRGSNGGEKLYNNGVKPRPRETQSQARWLVYRHTSTPGKAPIWFCSTRTHYYAYQRYAE